MPRTNATVFSFIALYSIAFSAFSADDPALLEEARKIATGIPPKLLSVLQDEMKIGGPEGAIGVCREKAPLMAKSVSEQTGWNVRRVSLKNRNPKATPDTWEAAVLQNFEKQVAAGEKPAALEKGELVVEGDRKTYRYMKALPTQELCLYCHGTNDLIPPAVKSKLKELYPEDKAVGYGVSEIRGAITLKKPL